MFYNFRQSSASASIICSASSANCRNTQKQPIKATRRVLAMSITLVYMLFTPSICTTAALLWCPDTCQSKNEARTSKNWQSDNVGRPLVIFTHAVRMLEAPDLLTQASIMSLAISLSLCSRCLANSGSGQCRSITNICRASSFQNKSSEVADPLLQGGECPQQKAVHTNTFQRPVEFINLCFDEQLII